MSAWGQSYRDKGSSSGYGGGGGRSYDRNYNDGGYSSRGRGGRYNSSYRNNYERSNQGYNNQYNSYRSNYDRQNQGYGSTYNNTSYNRNYQSNYQSRGRGSYHDYNRGGYNNNYHSNNNYRQNTNYSSQYNNNNNSSTSGIWGQQAKKDNYNYQSKPNSNINHRQVIIDDLNQPERPNYILSCYGHQRSFRNDSDGDVSFEELRWWQKFATQQQAVDQQKIFQTFNKAVQEKEKAFGQLRRQASQPPSLGGPCIITRDTLQILQEVFQNAQPFQPSAIHAPPIAQTPEEIEMQETPLTSLPSNNTFMKSNDLSMQSMQQMPLPPQQNLFQVQNIQSQQQLMNNNIQQQMNNNQQMDNNIYQKPVFQQSDQSPSISAPQSTNGTVLNERQQDDMDMWKQQKFELGMIPEEPPPPEVCR